MQNLVLQILFKAMFCRGNRKVKAKHLTLKKNTKQYVSISKSCVRHMIFNVKLPRWDLKYTKKKRIESAKVSTSVSIVFVW